MLVSMNCVREDQPGEKWKSLFDRSWPFYKKWYAQEGLLSRPGYLTCYNQLKEHMPELLPVYEQLCSLAGGGDIASRYLSLYSPPPFMSGCTQLAWTKPPYGIIRNYDYDPRLFEGVMLKTNWLKHVMGVSDCNWGLLDGINEDGLAVSLTFGGRNVTGKGFGIPLVVRYALETCATVPEAQRLFLRVPVHMAYNITMVDTHGSFSTLFLSPDRRPLLSDSWVATNHQEVVEWMEYAALTGTLERKEFLEALLVLPHLDKEEVIRRFFNLPLYHNQAKQSFVTLYTAAYNVEERSTRILWPTKYISQSLHAFNEHREVVNLRKYQTKEFLK
ncbi:MAG: C45 family peptidase [Bacteroidia bacterium]